MFSQSLTWVIHAFFLFFSLHLFQELCDLAPNLNFGPTLDYATTTMLLQMFRIVCVGLCLCVGG